MKRSIVKLIQVFILFLIYYYLDYYNIPYIANFFSLIMLGTLLAFFMDKRSEGDNKQNFKGNSLFLRYGSLINSFEYSAMIPMEWDMNKAQEVVDKLHTSIKSKVEERFALNKTVQINSLDISDIDMPDDDRKFLGVGFKTTRKAELNYFIFFHLIGKHLVGHYYVYFRGHYKWYDVALFILTSPLHIYSWIVKLLKKEFSIVGHLSTRVSESAFEKLDLSSFHTVSNSIIMYASKDILTEEGLITPEVANMITNNITNISTAIVGDNNVVTKGDNNTTVSNVESGRDVSIGQRQTM